MPVIGGNDNKGGAVEGQAFVPVTAVSAAYTVLSTDEFVAVTAGAADKAITLPSPSASLQGVSVRVLKVDSGAGHAVVNGTSPADLAVSGKVTLSSQGSQAVFFCDGTKWYVLGTVS